MTTQSHHTVALFWAGIISVLTASIVVIQLFKVSGESFLSNQPSWVLARAIHFQIDLPRMV